MNYEYEISKAKLMDFIEEYQLGDDYYGSIVITRELLYAIESGELDKRG